jgi:hypothetical protein
MIHGVPLVSKHYLLIGHLVCEIWVSFSHMSTTSPTMHEATYKAAGIDIISALWHLHLWQSMQMSVCNECGPRISGFCTIHLHQ